MSSAFTVPTIVNRSPQGVRGPAPAGEAFGRPGLEPRWATGSKEAIGTSITTRSKVWFTIARGIITEVYYPRVDIANTRDLQFLVTDGRTFFHEEQRDLRHRIELMDPRALAYRVINEDPVGRYRIVKEFVTDPASDCLLQRSRFEALAGRADDYKLFVLFAPHVKNRGAGNSGAVRTVDGNTVLTAWREDAGLALAASVPVTAASCGFVGSSDGWTDLHQDLSMDWQFGAAHDGNIALTAALDVSRMAEFTLALGFAADPEAAAHTALRSLAKGYADVKARFVEGWREYCSGLEDLSRSSTDGGRLYYLSAMVLRAHEDKTHPGAFVASLSVPWGETATDASAGGYHLCWPRDLVHIASGCLAAGDSEAALRALTYLREIQRGDGAWPQNCWVDGRPYWQGLQLDEVALPVLLTWRLVGNGVEMKDLDAVYRMVRGAALFLARVGPVTPQERWEENAGYSPATLASAVAALVCAATWARQRGERVLGTYLLEVADYWASKIEDWTFTRCGALVEGHPEYYERIATVRPEEIDRGGTECRVFLPIANRADSAPAASQCCIVDGGFLELVRYGLRRPQDPHILKTLPVYDAVLKVETKYGPAWRRYNLDGYGEHDDGTPYDGTGRGRAWPLLTGERGHFELASGRDPVPYIAALERFASPGGMLPEQVWDSDDVPGHGLLKGLGTGSATPLAWAHAEYIRLLRSAHDKKVFDLPEPVARRYPRTARRPIVQVWKSNNKLRAVKAGQRLRIEVAAPAALHWTRDNWTTASHAPMEEVAPETAIYSFEFPARAFTPGRALEFTFYWSRAGRWEGRDFTVAVI